MASSYTLASKYIALLDKAYKAGAKTSVLDVAPALVKAGANAGTFLLQNLALVGLGTYSHTDGPPAGDVNATWETHTYDYDRGRKFNVDAMDDLEAMGVFGNVASEFLRYYVTPEIDATRFAVLATAAGTKVEGDIDTGADVTTALNTAMSALDEAEVDDDRKVLFITPTLARLAQTQASTASTTDAFERCQVVTVPTSRFYTAVSLNAGSTTDAGGFTTSGHKINFLLMDKGAAFTDAKHTAIKYFTPEQNQTSDSYMFHYRIYHDAFPYGQKTSGIYVHYEDAVS